LFRIGDDGKLGFTWKYDVDTSGGKNLFWTGFASPPFSRRGQPDVALSNFRAKEAHQAVPFGKAPSHPETPE
jgi:hypothetical protein